MFLTRINHPGPTISRQGVRRSFLQHLPHLIPDHFFIAFQSRVPKAQDLDSFALQFRVPARIPFTVFRHAVLTPVQLDVQTCLHTKEVEDIFAEGMLSSEFVSGKLSITQPAPKQLFGPGVMFAQQACGLG